MGKINLFLIETDIDGNDNSLFEGTTKSFSNDFDVYPASEVEPLVEALREIKEEYDEPLGVLIDGAKMGKIATVALAAFEQSGNAGELEVEDEGD